MRMDEFPYGYERDIFEDMEPEEVLILASIGYYHVQAESEDLRASKQNRIASGFERIKDKAPTKTEKKEAERLAILYYERRNAENKAKTAMMHIYGRHKKLAMHRLIKDLEKKRAEEKKK